MRRYKKAILLSTVAAALMTAFVGYLIEENGKSYCYDSALSIGLSLANYIDGNIGCMPPLYFKDKATGERHSWRVLMLPNVAYEYVYEEYNFHESWNSKNNKDVATIVRTYSCPTHSKSHEITNNVAVVGENTLWQNPNNPDGPEYRPIHSGHKTDVERDILWPTAKGRSVPRNCYSKIVLVEMVDSNIPWMEPRDITLDEFIDAIPENPKGKFHNKYVDGIRAIDAGGRVTVINPYDDIDKIRNLFLVTEESE